MSEDLPVVDLEPVAPIVITFTAHRGRYLVQFAYNQAAVALLKATVPGAMRRWRVVTCLGEDGEAVAVDKRWEVSVDWSGPLASAFTNAGFEVIGLNHANIADWFGVFSVPVPSGPIGSSAYRAGLCKVCVTAPNRAGGVECEKCFRDRLIRQHHVKAVLAETHACAYPEAMPAKGSARTTRYPLEATTGPICAAQISGDNNMEVRGAHQSRHTPPATAVVDLLVAAEHEATGTCPICSRRPAKGAVVHTGCRTRLLHALDDSKPFTKARNAAFQSGACTACRTRPHHGGATCARCAAVVDVCRSLRPIDTLSPNIKDTGK